MAELSSLKNIGKEIERKLKTIGINSVEELKEIGSKDTWFRLKLKYPEICLVHLYTLEGAITETEYNQLSEETKKFKSIYRPMERLKNYNLRIGVKYGIYI